jgi:hypothetical protein
VCPTRITCKTHAKPAALCCAALAGDAGLELQLWCDRSVEGLLYCANHDPSIQARRAAVQLLKHVVLPSSSPTAHALTRCLAGKLCDKDRGVAAAALQLFVQVAPKVLCGCLTASQWCSAVQAGLGLVCGAAGGEGGGLGSSQGTQAAGRGGRGGREVLQPAVTRGSSLWAC